MSRRFGTRNRLHVLLIKVGTGGPQASISRLKFAHVLPTERQTPFDIIAGAIRIFGLPAAADYRIHAQLFVQRFRHIGAFAVLCFNLLHPLPFGRLWGDRGRLFWS